MSTSSTTNNATAATASKKRGAAAKKDGSNAPVFLRKTYKMIETANRDIASWADDGTSFVVKDVEKFAAEVIPEYFKHNKFSSFVRQLNFYGFRKIKSDPLRLRDAGAVDESKFWKFRHEKFQEGREDLLGEIRKSNHNEAADKQEVDGLKQEVKSLRGEVSALQAELQEMRQLVEGLVKTQQTQTVQVAPSGGKKRKISTTPAPVKSRVPSNEPVPVPSEFAFEPLPVRSKITGNTSGQVLSGIPNPEPSQRIDSAGLGSFTSQDEAMLADLFAQGLDDAKQTEEVNGLPDSIMSEPTKPDADVSERVRDALASLPKQMQTLFADRLVAVVSNPDALRTQAEALTALAASATQEAQGGPAPAPANAPPSSSENPELAAAVFEAYLNRKQTERKAS